MSDKERTRAAGFLAYTQVALDYDKYWSTGNVHQLRWNSDEYYRKRYAHQSVVSMASYDSNDYLGK